MDLPGGFASKGRKCPCCRNPWNATEDQESCERAHFAPAALESAGSNRGLDPANLDLSVRPQDDFYLFANGGWVKNPANACPKEYPSWNTFRALADLNLSRLKELLENPTRGTEDSKVLKMYNAFMDESSIEKAGLPPALLSLFSMIHSEADATTKIANLHKVGINPLFRIYSMPDKKDSSFTIGSLSQGGLGLPDRDYYFDSDKAEKRERYVAYVRLVLEMLGERGVARYSDKARCNEIASSIFDVETSIAASHFTKTECRDPEATWNKMSVSDLDALVRRAPTSWASYLVRSPLTEARQMIDFSKYFAELGKPQLSAINVAQVKSLRQVAHVPKHAAFTDYLAFITADSLAIHLESAFVNAHFEFHQKFLAGTSEQKPRWKTGLAVVESALGDDLGKLYCARFFSESAKTKALEIVSSVRQVLRERLQEVEWMSEPTRLEAIKKMDAFAVKIGFPDDGAWTDYTALEISNTHLENVLAGRAHQLALDLARVDLPTNKSRWLMYPHQVNAYFHPLLNEIVFPCAILQPPFFDVDADLAVQYGSFGCVVAHEVTHGYDDQGRKYNYMGNLQDWWQAADADEYEKRKKVQVEQANAFEVLGAKLNGSLTCGENIADLGGVKLAFRALQATPEFAAAEPINGFTPAQRFFLAWAQTWRDNSKDEYRKQMLVVDPHGPREFRTNSPLSNFSAFHEAFACGPGDKMWVEPSERVDIW